MSKILVSFSGGRTSAMMSWLMKSDWSKDNDLLFVFANMFRGERTTADLWSDKMLNYVKGIERPNMWHDSGCSESCEFLPT